MTVSKRKAGQVLAAAPWAGGKRTLAKRINEELRTPTFAAPERYAAAFVGGFSTEMQLLRCESEIINDANPRVVNVLKCLRDKPEEVSYWLKGTEFTKAEYESAKRIVSHPEFLLHPHLAFHQAMQLVVWWMGASGYAGTKNLGWFAQRHTKTGGDPAKRWASFKASIPAISSRLQGMEITCLDFRGFFLLHVYDILGQVAYVDPPYFVKSFEYEFDFTPQDHRDLARVLNSFERARIVLSYRDEVGPEGLTLDALYPVERWRRVRIDTPKSMASGGTGKRKAKRNVEVLLINDARN